METRMRCCSRRTIVPQMWRTEVFPGYERERTTNSPSATLSEAAPKSPRPQVDGGGQPESFEQAESARRRSTVLRSHRTDDSHHKISVTRTRSTSATDPVAASSPTRRVFR